MKKNLRVNISGVIFNIDEDAHELLKEYLDKLHLHFGPGESTEEIISDIEARIAEIFIEKNGDSEVIVNIDLVQSAIKAMGEPFEISDEEETTHSEYEPKKTYTYKNVKRRLYRDPENKIVGGVSSGLATYFNIDPIWFRLIFVLLVVSGMSILVYIVLWIAIPEAKTTAQRLEMRGEAINIDNIEKTIRDEFDDISERFKDMKDRHFRKKKGDLTIFEKLANAIAQIMLGVFKFIGAFIGIILAFVALILIIALIPSFIGAGVTILSTIPGLNMVSLPDTLSIFTNSSSEANLIVTSLAIVLFVPLIALVYQGIKLVFGLRNSSKVIGVTLLTIWITGIILLSFSSIKFANAFNKESEVSHYVTLKPTQSDTLYIELKNNEGTASYPILNSFNGQHLFCATDSLYYLNPTIKTKILEADEEFSMEIRRISHGRSYRQAERNANQINYSYLQTDSLITLDAYCNFAKQELFRGQHIEIIFGIPEGKSANFKNTNDDYFDEHELSRCTNGDKANSYIYIDTYNDQLIINSDNGYFNFNE